jgi:thiol-disulfide isomerase/thioredoxin
MSDLAILAVLILLVGATSWWWRARDGHVRRAHGHVVDGLRGDLGVPPGGWLLLLFTAPSCTPCVAARQVLDQLAGGRPDVQVASVDVGERLDLARAHHVMRAPTVLVVDEAGDVVARVSGVPQRAELLDILDASPSESAA